MLVLQRKSTERIRVTLKSGEVIEVAILKTSRGGARIGIAAPRDARILREELIREREEQAA